MPEIGEKFYRSTLVSPDVAPGKDGGGHGLWTPNEAFFIEIQNFWVWADKLGR